MEKLKVIVIVQASSRSWSGGVDLCMNEVDGYPAVYWTVKRTIDNIPDALVVVTAPEFDKNGALEFLHDKFSMKDLNIYYGHDGSPLARILETCRKLGEVKYIIRVDGLHMFFDTGASTRMLEQAVSENLDCCKFPDDFPVQFTSDVYRVSALQRLSKMLKEEDENIYRVHPKYYMFARKDVFRCVFLKELPAYSDEYLSQCRQIAKFIYKGQRLEVNKNRIPSGDQLSFHYELALKYLEHDVKVLDIACGNGYGTLMLAKTVKEVHGADIDPDIICEAQRSATEGLNVYFHVEDVTRMSFGYEEFDAVVSMETIEHVDPHALLSEVYRVLKPGGRLILSTPQNRLGHIPINAGHVREYSLDEIMGLCSCYFKVEKVIGIKAGRIVIHEDPIGTNTVVFCTKRS